MSLYLVDTYTMLSAGHQSVWNITQYVNAIILDQSGLMIPLRSI